MKESHLFAVLLLTGGELAVSAAEGAETIFRQRTPVIDVERRVERDGAPVLGGGGVDQGGKGVERVPIRSVWLRMASRRVGFCWPYCARAVNDIANFHIRRAGDPAALAVNAVLQRLVVQRAILQTQAFAVRPRLFRARIARIDPTYRAGGGTDRALNAAFKNGYRSWPGLRQGRGSVWRRAAR